MEIDDNVDNLLRIFTIYKKMPTVNKQELSIFLSVENILNVRSVNRKEVEGQLSAVMDRIDKLKKPDIMKFYNSDSPTDGYRVDKKYFENVVEQVKIYLMLRPALLEKYPELLI